MPSQEKNSLQLFLDNIFLSLKKNSILELEKSIQPYYKKYFVTIKGQGIEKFIKSYNSTLIIFIIVFAFRTLIIQPFQIPTNSMFPNLRGIQVVSDLTHKQKQGFWSNLKNKVVYV